MKLSAFYENDDVKKVCSETFFLSHQKKPKKYIFYNTFGGDKSAQHMKT